ncbi:hypothetical protein ccbrp13_59280 [Ktedonobacteria bacterium brp13]|nr:hypothetical protein ccbrp13_59280 [Ktedonobacteria bacterium brp13]
MYAYSVSFHLLIVDEWVAFPLTTSGQALYYYSTIIHLIGQTHNDIARTLAAYVQDSSGFPAFLHSAMETIL